MYSVESNPVPWTDGQTTWIDYVTDDVISWRVPLVNWHECQISSACSFTKHLTTKPHTRSDTHTQSVKHMGMLVAQRLGCRIGLDCAVFYVPPTQYRLYGRPSGCGFDSRPGSHLGQLSLPSLQGRYIEYQPGWARLCRAASKIVLQLNWFEMASHEQLCWL